MIETRKIGNTGVGTSQISLGCGSIGNLYQEVSDTQALALLHFAYDSGIRYFDTAPRYGSGLSEQRLGEFLKTIDRGTITLSTKVGRVLTPGKVRKAAHGFINPLPNDVHYDYSGDGFLQSLEGSCKRLGTDYIDILYVHDIGKITHGDDNKMHMDDLYSTGLPMLEKLKQDGRIGAYGLGVNECEICIDIMKEHPIDVILLAGRWTLLDRQAEDVLVPLCAKQNTSLVLGGIFNSGILATGPRQGAYFDYEPASDAILNEVRQLETKFQNLDIALATAALQFALTRDLASSVLIGTQKISSLKRNLEAAAQQVPIDHFQPART